MKRPLVLVAILGGVALSGVAVVWNRNRVEAEIRSMDRATLEQRIKQSPDDPEVFARLGALLVDDNEPEAALAPLEIAARAFPDRPEVAVDQIRALPDPNAGDAFAARWLEAHPGEANVGAERLRIRLRTGDPDGTLAALDTLPEKEQSLAPYMALRGETLLALRRLPEAVTVLKQALALRESSETRLLLARSLVPLQRYGEVVTVCAPLLGAKASTESEVTRARARIYSAGSRLFGPTTVADREEIRKTLESVVSLGSRLELGERFLPEWFLGECLVRAGRFADALAPLRKANTLSPEFPGAWFARARAATAAHYDAEAKGAFRVHRELGALLVRAENAADRAAQAPDDPELATARAKAVDAVANFLGNLPAVPATSPKKDKTRP
ncbi:MAG: hypothetical protein ACKO5K_00845 [Armatimonadota bacterium]